MINTFSTKTGLWGALLLAALLLGPHKARAQDTGNAAAQEVQGRPSETLSDIKERIEKTEALVESSRKEEEAILSELEESDRNLAVISKKADLAARKVTSTKARAKALEAEASGLKENLARQQEALAKTLRRLYRQGSSSTAQVLFTAPTLTEAAEQATYAKRLAQIGRERIARYKATLKELKERQRQLKTTTSRLAKAKAEADLQAEKLRRHAEAKRTLLASIQQERLLNEQAQREMEASARKLRALLIRLDEQQKAKTTYTVETERQALARDAPFSLLKGRLPWPLHGRVLKTPKQDALLHKGVFIEVLKGETIVAVARGTVVYSDYFRGYGNLCIIDHGASYHTLYAHAQELTVRVGERVEAGQIIGRAGSSGAASTPRLYFELRHRGRPINPLPWMFASS